MLEKAIEYAVQKHSGQMRKGKGVPYIVHPLAVMGWLYRMGADENLLAAGVLHDVVEDTDATIDDIKLLFGDDVAELVAAHTDDKTLEWHERKRKACDEIKSLPKRAQMLILADKLSNIQDMADDYKNIGDKLWERFKFGKEHQSWYYRYSVKSLDALADGNTKWAFDKYVELVGAVFKRAE